jgi:hypothetical protein
MRSQDIPPFDRDIREDEIFTFVVQPGDVGERENPERCVFARCAKRTMRTDEAWFGLSCGRVRLGHEIVRFGYSPKLYDAIHQFERIGTLPAGVYQVALMRASETRAGKAAKNARLSKNRDGSKPQNGKRRAWHAPRGWGRGDGADMGVVV